MAVRVKICGITNSQDADYAMQCGADYLGLIFVESSPRHVRPDQARRIAALRTSHPELSLLVSLKMRRWKQSSRRRTSMGSTWFSCMVARRQSFVGRLRCQ